jgi:hypothetical protein
MKNKFIDLIIEIYKNNKQQIMNQNDQGIQQAQHQENYAKHVYEYLLKNGIVKDNENN